MSGWPGGAGAAGVISVTVVVVVAVVDMMINKTNTSLRNQIYCLDMVSLGLVGFLDSQLLLCVIHRR